MRDVSRRLSYGPNLGCPPSNPLSLCFGDSTLYSDFQQIARRISLSEGPSEDLSLVRDGVGDAGLAESAQPQRARVQRPHANVVRAVARPGELERRAQLQPAPDDLLLRIR